MKTLRFLALFLACVSVGSAQSLESPGWLTVPKNPPPIVPLAGASGGVQARAQAVAQQEALGSNPVIAETITPEIQALARGLENDPVRIYNYVHDQIRHVLYFGSKKGAELTLLERSGNDFDQCALLVSLLRAAGYSPSYQFGLQVIPYSSPDHQDLSHWLGLSFPNTNFSYTVSSVSYLLGQRGYPMNAVFQWNDGNSMVLHRVWVALPIGGTTYYLDPAFKATEVSSGIDLHAAMGLSTNELMTAAAGTATADYVLSLAEGAVRNKLRDYSSNLVNTIEQNYPNASVEEIFGGRSIVNSTNLGLSQSLLFQTYNHNGQTPVVTWDNQPTNLMAKMSVSFSSTNIQWLVPQLQGRRLSMVFTNGTAQIWLEDSMLLSKATGSSSDGTVPVTMGFDIPSGNWDFAGNTLADTGWADHTGSADYLQTNATYALSYAFDASREYLLERQRHLDNYLQQGLANTSREVQTETLNIMGLQWMLQTELAGQLLGHKLDVAPMAHYRLGRVGQEKNRGYYVDVYLQLVAEVSRQGYNDRNVGQEYQWFDLSSYFGSAMEHGMIEQLQTSGLVAASTVKMIERANTNAVKIYLANSGNWTTGAKVRSALANYDLPSLDALINQGFSLLLPQNGLLYVAGSSSWKGYGIVAWNTNAMNGYSRQMSMLIGRGTYNGGYVSDSSAIPDSSYIWQSSFTQPWYYTPTPALTPSISGADPINMANGAFEIEGADLSLGQGEPRGVNLARFYSSSRRFNNTAGMSHGWLHSYCVSALENSSFEAGLGKATPAQMAPMLVATMATLELYNSSQPTPKNWTLTSLIVKWGIDQLINNGVSVSMGKDTLQFIKQPNGKFTAPGNCSMTLAPSGTGYLLKQRRGNSFTFDSKGRLTTITDPYSKSLSLTYTASNWVSTVTDWKSRKLTFKYGGSPVRLTNVVDSSGRSARYVYSTNYNSKGDLAFYIDPEGKTNRFTYDANHQIIGSFNGLGQLVVSNIYDGFGRVATQYTEGDTSKTWQIFWSGVQTVEQDPAGGKKRHYYDNKSRLVGERDALGNLTRLVYDGQDHVVMSISPLNETNQSIFDGDNNLVFSVDALGYTNSYIYDATNNLRTIVDGAGHTTQLGYNGKYQVTSVSGDGGDWVSYFYSTTDGTLSTRSDSAGTTSYSYDANGVLSKITYPGSLGYEGHLNNAFGDVLNRTNGRGFVTSFQYNNRRQLTNTVAPTNLTTKITFDASANVQTATDRRGFTSSNLWSATGKLLSTVLPPTPQGSPMTTNIYDSRDWLVRQLDPLQRPTLFTNDLAGRLISHTDPLLRTTRFGYDAVGRKTKTTNAINAVVSQQWNARGNLVTLTDGAMHTTRRSFDGAGNQLFLTNRNGKLWSFQFDGANRLTSTKTPLNRETSEGWNDRGLLDWVLEPSHDLASFEYDGRGRKTVRHDGVSDTSYYYDGNNNLTNVIDDGTSKTTNSWAFNAYDRVSSYRDADGNFFQYRHDANGNLTNLVYPGGKNVYYAYDSLNRLTNVTDWANRKTAFVYDLAGQLRSVTRPNGTVRSIVYDDAGQPTSVTEQTAGNIPIAIFRLNWDGAARVQWEYAAPVPHNNPVPTRSMTYDDDNRLATFNGQQVFNDLDGNMLWGPLNVTNFASYNFDPRNRLFNVTPSSGAATTYGYDALNNRASMFDGTNTTRFIVNPNSSLSQVLIRIKNGVTNYYVYGGGLLYEADDAGNTKTYHFDTRGSTIAITAANGMVTDHIEYSAYGLTTYRSGLTDTPFLFNGRYGVQTDANGLLYMRARYYNPMICRFVNPDPSGFSGGLNHYAFANGNPVSLIDPFGLCASQGWGGNLANWVDGDLTNPLMSFSSDSTAVNFLAYSMGSVVGGTANLFRLGQGTSSAMDANNGWDVAIGITEDVARATGLASLVGGGLEETLGRLGTVETTVAADGVATPYGTALQSMNAEAQAALTDVQSGATVYRQGQFGVQNTADAQFWSLSNPATTPGYAGRMGMPGGAATPDWIMGGQVPPGASVITRGAPGIGGNVGGSLEAVVPPGGVQINWFHMP